MAAVKPTQTKEKPVKSQSTANTGPRRIVKAAKKVAFQLTEFGNDAPKRRAKGPKK